MEWFGEFPTFNIPEEVWRIILFDYKLDKKALTNSTLASTTFSYVIHPNKTTLLFSQALPSLAPYLGLTSFWDCRQVCKTWQSDMDALLENHKAHQPIPHASISLKLDSHILPTFATRFHNPTSIPETSLCISGHPRNPFPGRSLSALMTSTTRNSILAVLNEFGEHVWYLRLKIWERPKLFAQYIMECMQRAPNLKALYITGGITGATYNQQVAWEHELERYLYRNYSPKLCHLEALQFPLPTSLSVAGNIFKTLRISSISSTLKRLILDIDCWTDNQEVLSRVPGEFVQLSDLELNIRGSVTNQMAALFQNALVRRLVVSVLNGQLRCQDLILRLLNQFANTLQVLQLRILNEDAEEVVIPNLELPHLKTLELVNCFGSWRALIIRNLSNIESVHVRATNSIPPEVLSDLFGKEIKTTDDIINSFVWKMYKKFKVFRFQTGNKDVGYCSREMYDFHLSKQAK